MAESAARRNVLITLDEQAPTAFYWQLTLLATLGTTPHGHQTETDPAESG